MKARVPKGMGGGMADMLKQAQKMQQDAAVLQEELEAREYTAVSGGGMVEVTVTGKHQLTSVKVKPEVVDPEDVEILEDMIMAAVNEAMRQADDTSAEEMEKLTGLDEPAQPARHGGPVLSHGLSSRPTRPSHRAI